jgi:glycolate oxidase FAD binding subunit
VAPSVEARLNGLRDLLGGKMDELGTLESRTLWRDIRDVKGLPADSVIWKISCAPTDGPAIVARIKAQRAAEAIYDWSGGLIWLSLPASADADQALVRGALKRGHATLTRAPEAVRAAVPVFEPSSPALAALSRRVKESFDPKGLFNPGRMG